MTRIKRSLFAISLLLGTAWTISPALAQVDPTGPRNVAVNERPHPDYDPIGIHAGGFTIYSGVDLSAEANDNVLATETNRKSDLIFTVQPYVSAQSNWSRHALKVTAGLADVRHKDDTEDDHTDGYVNADARLDIYHNSSLSFGGGYQDAHEPRTAAESAQSASELVHYTVGSGYVLGSTTLDRFRFSARGDYAKLNYDDVPGFPQDYRDHNVKTGTVRAEYALSPDTSLVAQASVNKHDYDSSNLGSRGQEYLVGVNTDLTHLIRGELDVGYTTQDYDDPTIGKLKGLAVHANIEWFPTETTTVTFTGAREVTDTGVIGSGGVLVNREGVRVDHELLRNVILTGGATVSQADYGGINRNDDWVDADVGATYLMNRHVGVSAGYHYSNYKSDDPTAQDYSVNGFVVSLHLKL